MPPDAIFRIHSMSKPITTVAALLLFEEGRFKLDDPVAKYLLEFKGLRVYAGKSAETVEARREMTIRDLIRHTSGLTYGMPNGTAVDRMYVAQGIDGPELSLSENGGRSGQTAITRSTRHSIQLQRFDGRPGSTHRSALGEAN